MSTVIRITAKAYYVMHAYANRGTCPQEGATYFSRHTYIPILYISACGLSQFQSKRTLIKSTKKSQELLICNISFL